MGRSGIIDFEELETRLAALSQQEPPLVDVISEAGVDHYAWQIDDWRVGYYPPNTLWDLEMFSLLTRERFDTEVHDMRLYTFWGRGLLRCMHVPTPSDKPFAINRLFDATTTKIRLKFPEIDTPNEEDQRDFGESIGWIYTR